MEAVMKDLGMDMEDEEDDNDIVDEGEQNSKSANKRHSSKKRSLSRARTKGYKEEKTTTQIVRFNYII